MCTFEKRGKHLYAWVEPVDNPNPKAAPPVVELRLSLTNIVNGKPTKGGVAVATGTPCACLLQFRSLPVAIANVHPTSYRVTSVPSRSL